MDNKTAKNPGPDLSEDESDSEQENPGTSSSSSSQDASKADQDSKKHSKTKKVEEKSANLSARGRSATRGKSAAANGKTSKADTTPGTSRTKRTVSKMNKDEDNGKEKNGKKNQKKLASHLSDDDSDSDQDSPSPQLEKVKKGLSAFRYQKSPKTPKMLAERKSAEPAPSTSKGKPTQRKKVTSGTPTMECLKVKVKKMSTSSNKSPRASGKKSSDTGPPSGGKKVGGKRKAKGQDKKEAKSPKEMITNHYVNLEERDEFFEVTRKKSDNIVLSLNRTAMGLNNNGKVYASPHEPYLRTLRSLGLYRTASPFDRRVTVIEWHPSHPTLVAAGSKGGDIILWNFEKVGADCFIQGIGPGGYVSALKFSPWNDSQVYTAQLDGTVNLLDFNGRNNRNFLSTHSWSNWYCSADVNAAHKMLVAGESMGHVVMMDTEGEKLWQHRLHKSKVTHVEFNTGCDWLMVTASTDRTVKLWDIRMVEGRGSELYTLQHDHPINSAYFSPNDHCKLLTTDQHHDLRVYSGPDWGRLDTAIYHPHRFFQHLTPIKACWHPMYDLAVVGRYPDNKSPHHGPGEGNTIDIFNINTGETVCQLRDQGAPGIKSLNKFSPSGESLVSAMGYNILIWQRKEILQDKQEKLMEKMQGEVSARLDTPGAARRPRSRPPAGKMAAKIKKKLQDQ
ncbi:DNA damage-binding protein 2-like [Branchiostoma lanceolatum]|uniref:DNA damage-binding protein 2-like n=1 Tax=Branchiostoma lanceolatum TaxID=7740 RepID=UPI0034520071